jgi:hypothetical protein
MEQQELAMKLLKEKSGEDSTVMRKLKLEAEQRVFFE